MSFAPNPDAQPVTTRLICSCFRTEWMMDPESRNPPPCGSVATIHLDIPSDDVCTAFSLPTSTRSVVVFNSVEENDNFPSEEPFWAFGFLNEMASHFCKVQHLGHSDWTSTHCHRAFELLCQPLGAYTGYETMGNQPARLSSKPLCAAPVNGSLNCEWIRSLQRLRETGWPTHFNQIRLAALCRYKALLMSPDRILDRASSIHSFTTNERQALSRRLTEVLWDSTVDQTPFRDPFDNDHDFSEYGNVYTLDHDTVSVTEVAGQCTLNPNGTAVTCNFRACTSISRRSSLIVEVILDMVLTTSGSGRHQDGVRLDLLRSADQQKAVSLLGLQDQEVSWGALLVALFSACVGPPVESSWELYVIMIEKLAGFSERTRARFATLLNIVQESP
ncbi:hypothetical protein BDZ88DRAFT_488000 [Geranomyces variabilis]|nr:hypothetical protein BDZ88DRAFT_488000 [Geranomyces variabilis]